MLPTKDRHLNRQAAHNFVDLVGQRFGRLTVISDSGIRKSRRPIWCCKCDCGKDFLANGKYLRGGDTKSCGCWFSITPAHNRDMVGRITKSFWTPLVKQAQLRGIQVAITREQSWELFEKQQGFCALSKVPLTLVTNLRDARKFNTASLDRIDSDKGYLIDNVQWVHKRINLMKNSMSQAEFITWCVVVASQQDG